MRYSLGLPVDRVDAEDEFVTGEAVAEAAAAAERLGFDAVFVTDHPAPDDRWLAGGGHHALEPTVALAYAAAATSRIRLHTHVFVLPYRNPFLAAKAVASLDALSGGRVILGVAAGYLRPEFGALGVDFDERNELCDEGIAVMRAAWTSDHVAVEGRRFRSRGVTQRPRPRHRPHPPIWVGGNSDRAIRRAVRLGQGWSPFPNPPGQATATKTPPLVDLDDLRERLARLRRLREETGVTGPFDVCFSRFDDGDPPDPYAELGVTWLTVAVRGVRTRAEWLDRAAALAARLGIG
jgi:probable F420-dependent oxidoreductase